MDEGAANPVPTDEPHPLRLRPSDWRRADADSFWRGRMEGGVFGAGVSVIFYSTAEIGVGPKLHVHDYGEIFIVTEGRARFTIGDETLDAGTGDILFGPAGVPHCFRNLGPGRLSTTDLHLSDRIAQTDLE